MIMVYRLAFALASVLPLALNILRGGVIQPNEIEDVVLVT